MSNHKAKEKKTNCLKHRQQQYLKALDGVIEGTLPPEYAHERFEKLKEIKAR